MLQDNHLITVGGTGRNVGKTEFVCRLIKKIARRHGVAALKVSAVFPDEEIFHGDHSGEQGGSVLVEEIRRDTRKDTSRMLRAGASPVFYLRGDDSAIAPAYVRFRSLLPPQAAIVCESNSLAEHVRPALHIVVTAVQAPVKERAHRRLASADLKVISDGRSGFPELDLLEFSPSLGWQLQLPRYEP